MSEAAAAHPRLAAAHHRIADTSPARSTIDVVDSTHPARMVLASRIRQNVILRIHAVARAILFIVAASRRQSNGSQNRKRNVS